MGSVQCYQVDERGVYLYTITRRGYGYLQVAVAPPDVPEGQVAVWTSALSAKADGLWHTQGAWSLEVDHRKDTLYTDDGEYALGSDRNGQSFDGIGDLPAWLSLEPPPEPELTLKDAQVAQLAEINTAFSAAAAALTSGYPDAEQLTWPIQQAEAQAWAADSTAATPYLDGLAAARGIDAATMRQLTLDQVNAFMAASQQLVGTRQKLRDQINAATSPAAVAAISWPAQEDEGEAG